MKGGGSFNKPKLGLISGYLLIFFLGVLIPILMWLDPNYHFSLTNATPLSDLGTTSASQFYFDAIFILSSIFALLYFKLNYFPSRELFHTLPSWGFAKAILFIGILGMSGTGIFDKSKHPEHMLAVLFMMIGFVGYIMLMSVDISDYYDYKNSPYSKLIIFGYIIPLLAILNSFYFRYTELLGLYTILITVNVFIWFIWELNIYSDFANWINIQDKSEQTRNGIHSIGYMFILVSILLLINSYIILFKIDFLYISCSTTNSNCTTPNAYSMISAAAILFIGYIKLNLRNINKQRRLNQKFTIQS